MATTAKYSNTPRGYKLEITFQPKVTYTLNLAIYASAKGKGLPPESKEISEKICKKIVELLSTSKFNHISMLKYIEDNVDKINSMSDIYSLIKNL